MNKVYKKKKKYFGKKYRFSVLYSVIFLTIDIFFFFFQVSTSTGVISHFVNVQVVVPEAFILGSGELHVDMGSAINLVCIIEKVCINLKIYMMSIADVLL